MTEGNLDPKRPLIDLVVPIHGQLGMNKIFFRFLSKNTFHPYRLIIVDNFSQDQSADFFESQSTKARPVIVLRNKQNQCYPTSINQGARAGDAPIVGLLNNDILAGPGWDRPLVEGLLDEGYPIVSPAGLEHFPDRRLEEILFQRWRYINKKKWRDDPEQNISEKIMKMYGDFDLSAVRIQEKYKGIVTAGIMGHCHLLTRETFEALNGLDPRIQGADWDLYLTVEKKRREGAFKSGPMILGGSFVHHFIRLTDSHQKRMPVVCTHGPHLTLEEKWPKKEIQELWPFKDQVPDGKKNLSERLHKKVIKIKTPLYLWRRDLSELLREVE